MDFNQFQQACLEYSAFPHKMSFDIKYWGLAIAGEAGEIADEIKKYIRDDDEVLQEMRLDLILNEMANTLYYLSRLASYLKIPLNDIAQRQINLSINKRKQVTGEIEQ